MQAEPESEKNWDDVQQVRLRALVMARQDAMRLGAALRQTVDDVRGALADAGFPPRNGESLPAAIGRLAAAYVEARAELQLVSVGEDTDCQLDNVREALVDAGFFPCNGESLADAVRRLATVRAELIADRNAGWHVEHALVDSAPDLVPGQRVTVGGQKSLLFFLRVESYAVLATVDGTQRKVPVELVESAGDDNV